MKRRLASLAVFMAVACGPNEPSLDEAQIASSQQALAACYPNCTEPPEPIVTELMKNGGFQSTPDSTSWTVSGTASVVTAGGGFCSLGDRCALLGGGGLWVNSYDSIRQSVSLPSTAKKIQISFSVYAYAFSQSLWTSGEIFTFSLVDSYGRTIRTLKEISPNNYYFEGGYTGWKRFGPFDVTDLKGRSVRVTAKVSRWYSTDNLQWRVDGVSATATY